MIRQGILRECLKERAGPFKRENLGFRDADGKIVDRQGGIGVRIFFFQVSAHMPTCYCVRVSAMFHDKGILIPAGLYIIALAVAQAYTAAFCRFHMQ